MQPKFPFGTVCTGRVLGFGEASKPHWDDDPPDYPPEVEEVQTGELFAYKVSAHGQTYFKYIINDLDIDPDTLEADE